LSAKSAEDVAHLREVVVAFFERDMIEEELRIPYSHQKLVSAIYERCRVLAESYDENGTRLFVRGRPQDLARLRPPS
jgi:GTP-binding protein HflX